MAPFCPGGVHWLRYLLQAAAAPLGDRNANFEDMSMPLQLLLLDVQLLLCAIGEELPVLCCCGVYHSY